MQTINKTLLIIILISILQLAGCVTAGKNVLSQDENGNMTMAQIYQQTTGLDDNDTELPPIKVKPVINLANNDYRGALKNRVDHLNKVFNKIANPQIAMYIYPHLVNVNGEQLPIPGYWTAFFLYRENHFNISHNQS